MRGPKLKRRENGVWYVYVSRSNRFSLKTKDETLAHQLFEEWMRRRREGKVKMLDRVKRIRLSAFRDEYERVRDRQVLAGEIVADTLKNDRKAFKRFIEVCGDIPLRMVNRARIEDFKARLLALGNSKATINGHMRALRAAFNWALIEDQDEEKSAYVEKNVFLRQPGKKPVMFKFETMPKFFEKDEIKSILSTAARRIEALKVELAQPGLADWKRKELTDKVAVQEALRHLFIFDLYSGLRRAELLRLEARDLKFDIEMIHVRKTKNKKERYVAMHPRLKRLVLDEMNVPELGRVFHRWSSPDYLTRLITNLVREAGVDTKTLHSARHAFATFALEGGSDLRSIQKELGHADITTTMVYAKVTDEHRKQQMAKLSFGIEGE